LREAETKGTESRVVADKWITPCGQPY